MSEKVQKVISLTLGVLAMSLTIGYLAFAAWTGPSANPPGGNVPAPINVGTTTQYKAGALGVGGVFSADNSAYLATLGGNVGIGTTTPDPNYMLDVSPTGTKKGIVTPYLKSPFAGDITKDGNIDFYDLRLVSEAFGCASGDSCWDAIIGADNLGNYLRKRDADLNGNGRVDISDVAIVSQKFKTLMTPYTRAPKAGDIDKDGFTDYRDLTYAVRSFGCASGDSCWDEIIGADNLGNYLRKRDADLNGNGRVDISDVAIVSQNYESLYYFESHGWGPYPAAKFVGASNNPGEFTLITQNAAGNPLLYIENTGNVGIGTIPSYKLDVNGDARIGTYLGIGDAPNSSSRIYAAAGTSYGIVASGSTAGGYFSDSDGTSGVSLARGSYGIYTSNNAYFGGNVSIGTTNPGTNKLKVAGDTEITDNLNVGGTVGMGWERIERTCASCLSLTVDCPAGKKAIGGGCLANTYPIRGSIPTGEQNRWLCVVAGSNPDTIMAVVICARMQ